MSRRTRHATSSQGDDSYPGIINQGYLSEYFLAYRLRDGLADLYRKWDERERDGEPTARGTVRTLGGSFIRLRPLAASTGVERVVADNVLAGSQDEEMPIDITSLSKDSIAAQHELISTVLKAFRWSVQESEITMIVGDSALTVPVTALCETSSGLLLVALGTVFASDPTTVAASKNAPAGTLLSPLRIGDREVARTAVEAAHLIFTADQPPAYVLVVSGGSLILLDRERWGEGIFIGANLDDAIARGDDRPKGELASIAALFSADAIDPGVDAQSVLVSLLDRSKNESAGVSKELRHGIRRSVELLAAAVVNDIRTRQKKRWEDIDADELTRQSLRYLYRIIVLLFAEARPELGILPVDDPDYQAGYSVARLRDVALFDLHSEVSANSNHIQQSLDLLFSLVDGGYEPDQRIDDSRSIVFPGLHSGLFADSACPMLDRARIPDPVLQAVLANLCFSGERSGRQRQSLSYATLGINQLGAVYEGLMAYRGFLATEPLYEVDNDGDADTGTWVIPVSKADEFAADFSEEIFVTEPGPDGVPRRVTYDVGSFVFRLAGRDRQRSASYYTPEVLTEFTVRHALDVYEEEHPNISAHEWLAMTICEPALGSGAFANEAINQLAARYLKAAQQERGEQIDPDRYQLELQKAKAHFAINRAYGVDLNRTAVELAEVSLWLNVMHEGLSAPRFDARLRRGNSLIGARRATYSRAEVEDVPWKATGSNSLQSPSERPLSLHPLGSEVGIHHFLVPGDGWGSASDAIELKGKGGRNPQPGLAKEWSEKLREWRKQLMAKPTKTQLDRLVALGRRVEHAWAQSAKDVTARLDAHQQHVAVWGAGDDVLSPKEPSLKGSADFLRADGPTARLRLLMDAWCALWMWAPANGTNMPSFGTWIDVAELLLGQPSQEDSGQLFTAYELQDGTLDSVEIFGKATIPEILERHPWLVECQRISEAQGFFHWELEFAPVFASGGFDLQVGNPPWVRPTWNEPASLAEDDPWWGITNLKETADRVKRERRVRSLTASQAQVSYVADRAENAGINALLASTTIEPLLRGVQTNLYMNFMTNTWRRSSPSGVVGLVHPESHFIDPNAGPLRVSTYNQLRRHWQFTNELFLFKEVHHETDFGVHIYSAPRQPCFRQAVNLFTPATLDRSLEHDGSGPTPGIQYPEGGWDLRPHADRIITVDQEVLTEWVRLFDEPGTPPNQSRLVRPLTEGDLGALSVFAHQPQRLGDVKNLWTSGFHESGGKDDGTFEWRTAIPSNLEDCILQGPHISNGTPFGQQPSESYRNNTDWDSLELELLPVDFVPRTLYQRLVSFSDFLNRQTSWDGGPYTSHFREAHREWVGTGSVRTLQSCILPPGPAVVGTIVNIGLQKPADVVRLAGLFSSLPYDYLIKTVGSDHIKQYLTNALPVPEYGEILDIHLLHRVLRLNCLISAYADLWSDLFDPRWTADNFAAGTGTIDLASTSAIWSRGTPLRTDLDRWLAFCEIDALVALMLGLTEDQLLQMYRSQFSVLRKYEYVTVFDANGRQISGDHHNHGFHQAAWEADLKTMKVARGEKKVGMWQRVQAYLGGDTSVDLGPFVPPFMAADRELAMSNAYQFFATKIAES